MLLSSSGTTLGFKINGPSAGERGGGDRRMET